MKKDYGMNTVDSYIFSIALSLILLIDAAEVIVKRLISLVRKAKELKTTMRDESLEVSLPRQRSDQTDSKRELGSGSP